MPSTDGTTSTSVDDGVTAAGLEGEVRRLQAENAALRRDLAERADDPGRPWATDVEWRELLDTLPQIVWVTRPDGWHTHFNQRWVEYTGLTLEESIGHGWNPPFHPQDRDRAASRWAQATSSGEPYEIEYRLRRADGVYRWMLGRALPLRDRSGQIVRWFGTCTDIEDLKEAHAELERGRTLHRLAGSMARLGGWTVDVADARVVWSEEIYEILDYPLDVDLGPEAAFAMYSEESQPRIRAAVDACIASGTPFDLEAEIETYQGQRRWVRVIGEPHVDADGTVVQLAGALHDITTFREAASRTEALAERLTQTLESITDGFYTLDRDWRFTYVNQQAEDLLRCGRDELLDRPIWEVFGTHAGTPIEAAFRRAMHEGVPARVEEYRYAPLDRWFQVQVYPAPQGLAVYFRDVTEERRHQEDLRERVKELHSLATINGGAHELTDPSRLCQLAASALVDAMRWPGDTSARVHLGDAEARAGTGSPVGRDTFVTPILLDGVVHGRIAVRCGGEGLLAEEEALVRSVAETLGLWWGRHHAASSLQEVNDELGLANRRLAEAAQFKDDLLSMASHELRTPLTPILGFAELLANHGENLTDDQRRMTRMIGSNARRMLRLVDDLLVMSRATAGVLVTRPELVAVIDVLLPELADLEDLPAGVEFDLDGVEVYADPQQLQQVLLNLITNASKYGAPPIVVRAARPEPGRVVVEVADQGPGVPDGFRERMWDRFTQKDRGDTRTARGTGLGLAIVKLLVEANGGSVGYRAGSPHGAVFTVELPASPT